MEIETVKAKDARDEFMQLLVTQLRHQDPLDPTKQEDFLSQLAQFSTLEQMERMNDNMQTQIDAQQQATQVQYVSQAATLVGRKVDYAVTDAKGAVSQREGTIASVSFESGQVKFRVGTDTVKWDQIVSVREVVVNNGTNVGSSLNTGGSTGTNGSGTSGGSSDELPLRRTRSSFALDDAA